MNYERPLKLNRYFLMIISLSRALLERGVMRHNYDQVMDDPVFVVLPRLLVYKLENGFDIGKYCLAVPHTGNYTLTDTVKLNTKFDPVSLHNVIYYKDKLYYVTRPGYDWKLELYNHVGNIISSIDAGSQIMSQSYCWPIFSCDSGLYLLCPIAPRADQQSSNTLNDELKFIHVKVESGPVKYMHFIDERVQEFISDNPDNDVINLNSSIYLEVESSGDNNTKCTSYHYGNDTALYTYMNKIREMDLRISLNNENVLLTSSNQAEVINIDKDGKINSTVPTNYKNTALAVGVYKRLVLSEKVLKKECVVLLVNDDFNPKIPILDNCRKLLKLPSRDHSAMICAEIDPFRTEEVYNMAKYLCNILTLISIDIGVIITQYCTIIESNDYKAISKYIANPAGE